MTPESNLQTLCNSNPPASITLNLEVLTADSLSELWLAGYLTISEYDALTMVLILGASKPLHQLSSIEKLSYKLAQVF